MTEPRYARLAARALAQEVPSGAALGSDVRDRIAASIAEAIRDRAVARRRRRSLRWLGAGMAAAVIALGIGVLSTREGRRSTVARSTPATMAVHPEGGVMLSHVGRGAQPAAVAVAQDGELLLAGDRLSVDSNSRATIALSSGTQLLMRGGSDLSVVELSNAEIFRLGSGAIKADVAKLHVGERFIVRTDDAEIEVRGTSFVVEQVVGTPQCGHGTHTRVSVNEGTVVVRTAEGESRVTRGESWPSCDADPAIDGSAEAAQPAPKPRIESRSEPSPGGSTLRATPSPTSDLAEQNRLFADAMAAKRRGDSAAAVAQFELLSRRYPRSALAENALAERMRLLRGPSAVRTAREYLSVYPNGYARAEAAAIVAGPP